MALTYVVDSIEDAWARIEAEDASRIQIPERWLPPNAKESTVVRIETSGQGDNRTIQITIDREATDARLEAARDLRKAIPKGATGDIDL